jgi:Radical SAM superfamily
VVVTGEQYVLLELLNTLIEYRSARGTMRSAFEQARSDGALETLPGLVYLAPGASAREPALIDTGLQRLVRDLDELPGEETALELLEPPHRGTGLSPKALEPARVGRCARIASLLVTQGCKFNCSYCPIPAVNQKSWRSRSPEALVRTIASIYERFHIKYFFEADDNFFNRRETAEGLLTAMARSTVSSVPFRERIRFATEATQFDTYRNHDLLPLARDAGMHALWFGIEDLTATLINKGQKPTQTIELFRLLAEQKISPMAMMMFHEGQPYYTRNALYGLYNQIKFLREAGAVSMQCTVHGPAVGTREQKQPMRKAEFFEASAVTSSPNHDTTVTTSSSRPAKPRGNVKSNSSAAMRLSITPPTLCERSSAMAPPCAAGVSAISWSGWLPWYGLPPR